MGDHTPPALTPRIWQVGALCRAVADALEARFNPVAVRGEISGLSRPASGHLYFSLKDAQGQLRCAMFRRAAGLLDFTPREGEMVEVLGRLGVYEPRGDLQLIVESMKRAGQGALFEQFLQLKARLEAQGLFDPQRKRRVPLMPRGIGIVTSLGAAALHDVVTCLARRAPHVPVVLAPAPVQGTQAAGELAQALRSLYRMSESGAIDVILLVRGGGSIEDLWSFNDEQLARTIVESPVPVISGVGHETDFTIADFCADVRAPTPTAAAELAAQSRDTWISGVQGATERLVSAVHHRVDVAAQRVDQAGARLGRPLARLAAQEARLGRLAHRLRYSARVRLEKSGAGFNTMHVRLRQAVQARLERGAQLLDRSRLRMELLDPRLVLQRGYALLTDDAGRPVTSVAQTRTGQDLVATLADGEVAVTVAPPRVQTS
ncbi:MAG TPA: exodeoxyribonuclease VII large subunit [Ramlibacter sp.]|nr:exodeoxyribonuclease VII large subunit [Ramlibacter sp.]